MPSIMCNFFSFVATFVAPFVANFVAPFVELFVVPCSVDSIAGSKPHGKPFIVMTVYRPSDSSAEYFDKVEEFIAAIDSLDKEFYILGDFNCNWLRPADPETRRLKTFCDLYQLSQLINEPTRVTETSSSLLSRFSNYEPFRNNNKVRLWSKSSRIKQSQFGLCHMKNKCEDKQKT